MNALRLSLILGLVLGPVSRVEAQSTGADALKRAGLLPGGDSKPPTISKQEGELVRRVITEMQTERGRQAPAPEPGKPVYYIAYDGGLSANIKGVKPPPPAAMGRTVRAALAMAGYEPATNEHRPSVAIVYRSSYENKEPLSSNLSANAEATNYTGTIPAPTSVFGVNISAFDYADLTRSTHTLLWDTRCTSMAVPPPLSSPEETFLAFVTACAPYFGARLPDGEQRKMEVNWVAIPRREDLTDPTPAFAALSPSDPVLDQHALREMERKVEAVAEEIGRAQIGAGNTRRPRPDPSAPVEISPALGRRIANYLKEKTRLQEALAARTQGLPAGGTNGALIDAFAAEHASQISALTLTGEAIRRTIAQIDKRWARDDLKRKTLDELLQEFEAEIKASTDPAAAVRSTTS